MESQIWIPSKGRPYPLLSRKLCDEQIKHTVWVEPQDEAAYIAAYKQNNIDTSLITLRILPENDKGITFVRQEMLDELRSKKLKVYTLDDDFCGFRRVVDTATPCRKMEKITILQALECAENMFIDAEIGYGCFIHHSFCIFKKAGLDLNRLDDGAIWLDGARIPLHLNYDNVSGRETLYFAALSMLVGVPGAHTNDIATLSTVCGNPKMKGGCASWYADWNNVIRSNIEVENLLQVAVQKAICKLSKSKREKLANYKFFKTYNLKFGPRKGMSDFRPRWAAFAKLRDALKQEACFL